MACEKCTSVAQFPQGCLCLYINASHSYILEKVGDWLSGHNYEAALGEGQISLETEEFHKLVRELGRINSSRGLAGSVPVWG